MAVKPITNKQIVSNPNRGKQTSTRNTTNRSGNSSRSYVPGLDITKGYSITLKDVDTAILSHVKKVMKPKIREANETIDVNVMYGNEERWKAVRKRGVLRDKNGSLILPLIMLRRVSVEKSDMIPGYEHDIQRRHTEIVRNVGWSKDNRYSRFGVQIGNKPVHENLVTTVPNFVNISYDFVLWTNFIEQMNDIVELFIEESNKYWGDSQEYKFHCNIDTITDASEMSVDDERFIRSTFSVTTKAYLLPEYMNSVVTNKVSNMRKELVPSKVVFGFEGDATDKQVGK